MLQIGDNNLGYNLRYFCVPTHYEEDLESILIPAGMISDRYDYIYICYLFINIDLF